MSRPYRSSDKQGVLLLEIFRQVERDILRLLPPVPWIRHLVRGCLVALEDAFIERQVQTAVDDAIEAYRASQAPLVDWRDQVVMTETDSKVPGLPELRITSTIVQSR